MTQAKVQAGGIIRRSLDQTWRTPERFLAAARLVLGDPIPLDPANAQDNPTRAARYCTDPSEASQADGGAQQGALFGFDGPATGEHLGDGLAVPWDWPWWCNPPYGRALKTWLARMASAARRRPDLAGLAFLPCARWEQSYLTDALAAAACVCFVRGRVAFVSSIDGVAVSCNPYASMILGFNVRADPFDAVFRGLGACFVLTSTDNLDEERFPSRYPSLAMSPTRNAIESSAEVLETLLASDGGQCPSCYGSLKNGQDPADPDPDVLADHDHAGDCALAAALRALRAELEP